MKVTVRIDGVDYVSAENEGDATVKAHWFTKNLGDISSLRIQQENGRHVIFCEELLKRAIIIVED